jgi:hypothetical protein
MYNCCTAASTPSYGTCSLPGCNRPKYRDPANGRIHDYCGRTHASQAIAQGVYCTPGWKGRRVRANIRRNSAENARLLLTSYHAIVSNNYTIPCGNAPNRSFRLDQKLKYHGVTSTLRTFESLVPRLQCPGSIPATKLVNHQNTIVFFSRTRSHLSSPAYQGTIEW